MFMSVIILCMSAAEPLPSECMAFTSKAFFTSQESCEGATIVNAPQFAASQGKEIAWATCIETNLFDPQA